MHGVGVSWPVGTEEVQEATAAHAANSAYPARTRACGTADDGLSHSQFPLLPGSRRLEPTEILTDLVAPLKPRQPQPPKSHSRRLLRLASLLWTHSFTRAGARLLRTLPHGGVHTDWRWLHAASQRKMPPPSASRLGVWDALEDPMPGTWYVILSLYVYRLHV